MLLPASLFLGKLFAEVGVGAVDPVFSGRGEDVEIDGVFEGLGGMRQVWRDDEGFSCGDGDDASIVEGEAEGAGKDVGNLLVVVAVTRDDGSFAQDEAGEHALCAVDELSRDEGVELLDGDAVKAGVLEIGVGGLVGRIGHGWLLLGWFFRNRSEGRVHESGRFGQVAGSVSAAKAVRWKRKFVKSGAGKWIWD